MKKTLIVITTISLFVVVYFFVLGKMSQTGNADGLLNGKLQKCPDKPSCVSSEPADDSVHFVPPLVLSDLPADQALSSLKDIIQELGGEFQKEDADYLSATFSSSLFGFTDDVELRLDAENNVIHIRSVSRVGYGDLGVNRKRVELIRKLFVER